MLSIPDREKAIQRCIYEQGWMLSHFGPMTSGKLDQIGHTDWLIEELMLRLGVAND